MALDTRHKLKLLYLLDILKKQTDVDHGITIGKIIKNLESNNINAERKSLYRDFESLRDYGVDIFYNNAGHTYHYGGNINEPEFDIVELKLLVDAVQSSKFISGKKSRELIDKLKSLTNIYNARELDRGVVLLDRVKSDSKGSMSYLDTIHKAINNNHPITFKYFEWAPEGEKKYRHNGQVYKVSPFALIWNESNYYLVAYDGAYSCIKHFRVDKMTAVNMVEDEKRQGEKEFKKIKVSEYNKKFFSMYHGEDTKVTLRCSNEIANVIYDRFGKDIFKQKIEGDDTHFVVRVEVNESPMFYSWLAGLGDSIKVTEPQKTVDAYKNHIKKIAKMYK